MSPSKRRDIRASITSESLKAQMCAERDAGNTRYGGDGERILAEFLRDHGHTVEWVHAGGIDFSINGRVNVDVKAHLALERSVTRAPKVALAQRAPGVIYPYVVFFDDVIRIYDCPLTDTPDAVVEISWKQACEFLERTVRRARPAMADPKGVRAAQREGCRQLTQWIGTTWRLAAYVVCRGNPLAQARMSRQGWGLESFHQDVKKSNGKVDVVVLVYFDGSESRTVFAYPLSHSSDIQCGPKPVGPNRNGRKTFDPKMLHPKFVFAGIEQFQREFCSRFLQAS